MTTKIIESQFAAAYAELVDKIFRYFLFRTNSRDDAQELSQETFIHVWKRLVDTNQQIDNLKGYIYKTAHNLLIDFSQKKQTISLEEMAENGLQIVDNASIEKKDFISSIMIIKEIEKLEKDYREILFLRYIDDLSVKEIAQQLGINESLASVRIYRGLKQLKQRITI